MAVDTISINTGLDGFVFPSAISKISDRKIDATVLFKQAADFIGIEVLAQTAAMHVRYLCDFNKHAFLLKVERFEDTLVLKSNIVYDIYGEVIAKTDFVYSCRLSMCKDGEAVNSGIVVIAVKSYDDIFKKEVLKEYYRNRLNFCMGNKPSTIP